jgi:hypothetical protein
VGGGWPISRVLCEKWGLCVGTALHSIGVRFVTSSKILRLPKAGKHGLLQDGVVCSSGEAPRGDVGHPPRPAVEVPLDTLEIPE